jgi:hypothetical protein
LKRVLLTAEDVKKSLDDVFQYYRDFKSLQERVRDIIVNASRLLSDEEMDEVLKHLDRLLEKFEGRE